LEVENRKVAVQDHSGENVSRISQQQNKSGMVVHSYEKRPVQEAWLK
jgi:hypothetical protein